MQCNSQPRGFSLIELLCVISISAILVNIAHASYNHGILKMKRLEAKSALLELQSNYTRYFMTHHSYQDATLGEGNGNDIYPRNITNEGTYRLVITHQDATSYLLSTEPLSTAMQHDEECGEFTLNQLGERGITGTGSLETCWGG